MYQFKKGWCNNMKKKLFTAILSVSLFSTIAASSAFAMHDPGGGGGGGHGCPHICLERP